ncbi:unnamed protein product [Ambrosiozyma monospora]|uniref:Unnamed protein product n=1 Tax=Ambrosiozyma monospora TaxID=43982 RepID=A0A9W6YUR6_AMBMO|nr:unnamed protein product [Ambrosiozyma monospora]
MFTARQFSRYSHSMGGPSTRATKILALSYMSVGLTVPFLLPLKYSLTDCNPKNNDGCIATGHFNIGNAFRI